MRWMLNKTYLTTFNGMERAEPNALEDQQSAAHKVERNAFDAQQKAALHI